MNIKKFLKENQTCLMIKTPAGILIPETFADNVNHSLNNYLDFKRQVRKGTNKQS